MKRFRALTELLMFTTGTEVYCESQNAAERIKKNTQAYSSKSRWRLQEVKKWTRKSTTRDKRSSDIYRMNPWKRPRTIKMRSRQYPHVQVSSERLDRFSAQCSDSRQVTLKSNWARHIAFKIKMTRLAVRNNTRQEVQDHIVKPLYKCKISRE